MLPSEPVRRATDDNIEKSKPIRQTNRDLQGDSLSPLPYNIITVNVVQKPSRVKKYQCTVPLKTWS